MEVVRSSEEEAKKSSLKLHMWTNVPFDNGCGGGAAVPEYSAKFDHSLTKENLSPCVPGSNLSSRLSSQIRHPLRSNPVIENQTESTPGKCGLVGMKSICSSTTASFESQEPRCDDAGNIDSEIEAIEKEISRLSSRLEYLRLEKAKQIHVKTAAEKRGRFIPAKFMDPPPSLVPGKQNPRKIEESASARKITPRSRGLSMVPSEIARGLTMAAAAATPVGRRGISLGPAEIYSATRSRQLAKQQEITPVYQSQSRRKSCFWKLQEVDELKVIKERGKSMSMSPKSRKTASKLLAAANPKMAVTSLGAAKSKFLKKEEGLISSIQPKKLFKDGDKSVPAKKPSKPGRMVASRYNKSSNGGNGVGNSAVSNSVRKRSLPENDKEIKICDKKRISLSGKSETVSEISLKQSAVSGDDPLSVIEELEMLPKIKTLQCKNESPRDSGPAKRVVELVRRRSHFSLEDDERGQAEDEANDDDDRVQPTSACKALSFEEGEEEEKMILKEYPKIKTLPRINSISPRDSGAAKRISELIGRKSYFSSGEGLEEEISGCQTLSFEEED